MPCALPATDTAPDTPSPCVGPLESAGGTVLFRTPPRVRPRLPYSIYTHFGKQPRYAHKEEADSVITSHLRWQKRMMQLAAGEGA
jgi:hypothetical protein